MSDVEVSYPETAADRMLTALEQQEFDEAMHLADIESKVKEASTLTIVRELYDRGVKIEDIFGRYYEFEMAGDARTMDVEDALLAGYSAAQSEDDLDLSDEWKEREQDDRGY